MKGSGIYHMLKTLKRKTVQRNSLAFNMTANDDRPERRLATLQWYPIDQYEGLWCAVAGNYNCDNDGSSYLTAVRQELVNDVMARNQDDQDGREENVDNDWIPRNTMLATQAKRQHNQQAERQPTTSQAAVKQS